MKTKLSNEPVLAADIIKIVAWLVAILVTAGVFTSEDASEINRLASAIAPLAAMALQAGLAWWQRQQVTPVLSPRDNDGNRLVPEMAVAENEKT